MQRILASLQAYFHQSKETTSDTCESISSSSSGEDSEYDGEWTTAWSHGHGAEDEFIGIRTDEDGNPMEFPMRAPRKYRSSKTVVSSSIKSCEGVDPSDDTFSDRRINPRFERYPNAKRSSRNNRTIRRKAGTSRLRQDVVLSRQLHDIQTTRQGQNYIPTTEVDQYFQFHAPSSHELTSTEILQSLNSEKHREDILTTLQKAAINTSFGRSKQYGRRIVRFTLPVNGYKEMELPTSSLVSSNPKLSMNKSRSVVTTKTYGPSESIKVNFDGPTLIENILIDPRVKGERVYCSAKAKLTYTDETGEKVSDSYSIFNNSIVVGKTAEMVELFVSYPKKCVFSASIATRSNMFDSLLQLPRTVTYTLYLSSSLSVAGYEYQEDGVMSRPKASVRRDISVRERKQKLSTCDQFI